MYVHCSVAVRRVDLASAVYGCIYGCTLSDVLIANAECTVYVLYLVMC